ncbi:hypothetical protein GCM10027347_54220 [Larkinella harenae]
MFESIRAYFKGNRLEKAVHEAQLLEFTNFYDAARVCNRLFSSGKDYSVVKHKNEELFWAVKTKLVKALVDDGHVLIKPKDLKSSRK